MGEVVKNKININVEVNASIDKVWEYWTDPKHIIRWNFASDDWQTTYAENDLRPGGKFKSRMEAKDGSMGFDFAGTYVEVKKNEYIKYKMDDNRMVEINFVQNGNHVLVEEEFEAEDTHSLQMQKDGWQAIMNNFKSYAESTDSDKLEFEILIDAPVSKVYKCMIDEKNYREWTHVFNPTSHYRGSWDKGSKILFIGCDENGTEGGMVSRIKENIPDKFISIEHLGIYKDGNEITEGPDIEGWGGALENYTFKEENGKTRVAVDMDSNKDFEEYFAETWPKALNTLKQICES